MDILPVAYTPMAKPGAVEKNDSEAPKDWPDLRFDQNLIDIANKHGKTVTQVILNWGVSRNYVVLPKSNTLQW